MMQSRIDSDGLEVVIGVIYEKSRLRGGLGF